LLQIANLFLAQAVALSAISVNDKLKSDVNPGLETSTLINYLVYSQLNYAG
jgi:hypothetical protein